jgi:hypothetical protein
MRDLDREQSFVGDDVEKKTPRDPRADAHLPGLEHDIFLTCARFVLLLRGIRAQLFDFAGFGPDLQKFGDQLRVGLFAFADLLAVVEKFINGMFGLRIKFAFIRDSS